MNCHFENKEELEKLSIPKSVLESTGNTMQELISTAYRLLQKELGPNKALFLNPLTFYHDASTDEIDGAFDYFENNVSSTKSSSYQSVTGIAQNVFPLPSKGKIGYSSKRNFVNTFRRNFGTNFHKCFSTRNNPEEFSLAIENFIVWIRKEINALNTNKYTDFTISERDTIVAFLLNFNLDKFEDSLRRTILIFDAKLQGKHVQIEKTIWYQYNDKDIIGGKPDLVVYDDKGNITIYDFKTSFISTDPSDNTLKYHYILLDLYRNILAKKLGIDPNKIKIVNQEFGYSSNSEISLKGEVNPDTDITGQLRVLSKQFVEKFFPIEATKLDTEEAKQVVKDIDTIRDIFLPPNLEKFTLRLFIKDRIESAIKNKNSISLKLSLKIIEKIELNGEILRFIDSDGKEVFKGKIEEAIDKEIYAIESKFKSAQMDIITGLKFKNIAKFKLYFSDEKKNLAMYQIFAKYCTPMWSYIESPILEKYGVVMMQCENPITKKKTIEFIQLIPNISDIQYVLNPKDNILTPFFANATEMNNIQEFRTLPQSSTENVYKLLAAVAISKAIKTLPKDCTISCIKSVAITSGAHDLGLNNESIIKCLELLEYEAKNHPENLNNAKLFLTIASNLKSINWQTKLEIIALATSSALHLADFDPDVKTSLTILDKVTIKKEAIAKVMEAIQREIKGFDARKSEITNELELLYADLAFYYNSLDELTPETMYQINDCSLTLAESVAAGFNLFTRADTQMFTLRGLLLTGLAQGLHTSITYASPDELIRHTLALFRSYGLLIANLLGKELEEVNKAIKNYIQSNKPILDSVRGNHDDLYELLIVKDDKLKIHRDMLFLNPYDSKNTFIKNGKECLEVLLWHINKRKIANKLLLPNKAWELSYEELKKDENAFKAYKRLVKDSEFRRIPLIEKRGASGLFTGLKQMLKGDKDPKVFAKDIINNFNLFVDPTVSTLELKNRKTKAIEKNEYFNYLIDSEQKRAERCEAHNPSEWLLNLNQLVAEYIVTDYKQIYFTKFLNSVDKLLATIRLMEVVTGKNFSKLIDALVNNVKVSVYNQNIIDEEYEDLIKLFGGVKYGISLAKIALRPALFMKEMLLGRLKNTSAIITNQLKAESAMKQITITDLTEAAGVVFGKDFLQGAFLTIFGKNSIGDFSFVDQLNSEYLINDRDLNTISETMSYDNYGWHNMGTRMLYMNTVKPDWFNRMILFIAKMKADGTFNSYKLNEDKILVYSFEDDARVNFYWKNRNNFNSLSESELIKYKELEAFYKLKLAQFNREGYSLLEGVDKFPKAYTSKDNDSVKELIGLIYGFYGHEERANMLKGLWWNLHSQFLTFLPAEIRRYFATGKIESAINQVIHLKDPNGDLLYWKEEYGKDGNPTGVKRKTTEKISDGKVNEPVLESVACPLEGLATSTAKEIGRIFRLDKKALKEDPQALKNAELFLFNALIAFIVSLIIKQIYDANMDVKSLPILASNLDIILKVANELNFYESVIKPVDLFGLVGTDFIHQTFAHALNTIQSDGYSLLDFGSDTFSIISDTHLV